MTSKKHITAVVTTFAPSKALLERLRRVKPQVNRIIVIDDSGHSAIDFIKSAILTLGVDLIINKENSGIAASLNAGIIRALESDCDYVLTLDDDTLIECDYVEKVITVFNTNPDVLLGAGGGQFDCVKQLEANSEYCHKRNLITSGCIYPVKVFDSVGLFDESLFIDLVDFEYCTRLRSAGFVLFEVPMAKMSHTIGESKVINLCFTTLIIYNHSPFRLYYQVRNVFLYSYKHLFRDPFYCGFLFFGVAKTLLKVIFFEKDKLKRSGYIISGLCAGIVNKKGRLE